MCAGFVTTVSLKEKFAKNLVGLVDGTLICGHLSGWLGSASFTKAAPFEILTGEMKWLLATIRT
jgi:hypothetical protein